VLHELLYGTFTACVSMLQFYSLLESSAVANSTLQYRQVTLFAPTNLAFQKYTGSKDDLILYHMSEWQIYVSSRVWGTEQLYAAVSVSRDISRATPDVGDRNLNYL